MKKLINLRMCILLLGVGLFALFSCDAELTDMEDLVDLQETFDQATSSSSRARNILITGTVLNPVTGEPINRAKVQVGNAVAFSNTRGRWSVKLGNTGDELMVRVTKDDHVDFIFPVSFCDIRDNSTIDWTIDLPPNQPSVVFTPGTEASISYEYKEVIYTVTVPADATDRNTSITVGPGGTVVGEGISRYFAIVGVDFEDDEQELVFEENFDFANEVVISYDPLAAAELDTILSSSLFPEVLSGGIGSINPAVFERDAPECFQEIAMEWQEAMEQARDAKESSNNAELVSTIFVDELYEDFLEELCGVEEDFFDVNIPEVELDGNVTVNNTTEGTLLLGIGIITDTEEIYLVDQEGEPYLIDREGEPFPVGQSTEPFDNILTIEDECRCNCSGADGIGADTSIGLAFLNSTEGESAYQAWLAAGNSGSLEDFLNSPAGQQALLAWLISDGSTGSAFLGSAIGESAYQAWLAAGNSGSPEDFLNSSAGQQALLAWISSGGSAGSDFLSSAAGESAYQAWLAAGNSGSISAFLASIQGATGAQGVAGAQGPQGPSGAQGPQGPQGPVGAQGPAGSEGPAGPAGAAGAAGAQGAQGPAGPQGPAGAQGPQGPQGPAGGNGANGLSAYQVWLGAGNSGSLADFFAAIGGGGSGSGGGLVASVGEFVVPAWSGAVAGDSGTFTAGAFGTVTWTITQLSGADASGNARMQVRYDFNNIGKVTSASIQEINKQLGEAGKVGLSCSLTGNVEGTSMVVNCVRADANAGWSTIQHLLVTILQ